MLNRSAIGGVHNAEQDQICFAAGLFLNPSFAAKAEVLDAITDAPSSIFEFFRGVLASDAAKQPRASRSR